MGKLIVTEFVTLDGVAQAPGGPEEDLDGGFVHGGWMAPFAGEESGRDVLGGARSMDALLLGRRTYEIFAGYWPAAPEDDPFAELLNGVSKHVASRTLAEPLGWRGSSLIGEDLVGGITAIKAGHEEVHVIGSLDLVQSLLGASLVDRLDLWVFPVVLGTGKRLFAGGTLPTACHLADAVPYPSGAVHLTYEVGGPPGYGNMGG